MTEPVWVLDSVVESVHSMLLSEHGGDDGTRDKALLASALSRPKQRLTYAPDSTLFELATAYAYGIAKNHPFLDGNKRVAFTVGALFLELNGHQLTAPEPEAAVTFTQLASGNLTEETLAQWYEANSETL